MGRELCSTRAVRARGGCLGTLSELLEGPVLCLHHCRHLYVGPVWMYVPKVCVGTLGWDV